MNLENYKRELLKEGIESDVISVNKNGNIKEGLRLGGPDTGIHPVIYPTVADTVPEIIKMAKSALENLPEDAVWMKLSDWDYVRKNIHLGIQKRSEEAIYKRNCLNTDIFMRVQFDFGGSPASSKVGLPMAKILDVEEKDLWEAAIRNDSNNFLIRSISDVVGIPCDTEEARIYVVTSETAIGGATALAFPHVFRNFCKEKGENVCYILPSSTEEVLIVTESAASCDPREFAYMVREINSDLVDPAIQLDPVVYRYRLDTDQIEIIAEA